MTVYSIRATVLYNSKPLLTLWRQSENSTRPDEQMSQETLNKIKEARNIPKFIDHHATMPMQPEMAQVVVQEMKSEEKDDFGVIGLNAFVGEKDTWCLTDAPNAEAVHKGHEGIGVNLGPGYVTEINSLV